MDDIVQGVAAAQIRSVYDRWLRLEEDKKAISDDLKDLFAEATGNGFNSKLLRKSFAIHRAREENANEVEEADAVIDLYLNALEAPRVGAHPAHTRQDRAKARMSESMADHKEFSNELAAAGLISAEAAAETVAIADAMARKFGNGPLDHDPETGEVIEDQTASFAAFSAPSERAADESSDNPFEPPIAEPTLGVESREDSAAASAPSEATTGDADGPAETAAPSSMTGRADAALIHRVVAAKTKGLSIMDSGDSLRVERLVSLGALVRDNGRLYAAAFRRSA